MNIVEKGFRMLLGIVKGALITFLGAFGLIAILDSPVIALHLVGILLFFVTPFGASMGSLWTGFSLYRQFMASRNEKIKNDSLPQPRGGGFRMGISLFLALIISALIIHRSNAASTATHGAAWMITDDYEHYKYLCDTPIVVLTLDAYGRSEVVCSPELIGYLEQNQPAIIPITYHISRWLGLVTDSRLITVGPLSITSDERLGVSLGCREAYEGPCDTSVYKMMREFYVDSWPAGQPDQSSAR
jgi:hypothetical protein